MLERIPRWMQKTKRAVQARENSERLQTEAAQENLQRQRREQIDKWEPLAHEVIKYHDMWLRLDIDKIFSDMKSFYEANNDFPTVAWFSTSDLSINISSGFKINPPNKPAEEDLLEWAPHLRDMQYADPLSLIGAKGNWKEELVKARLARSGGEYSADAEFSSMDRVITEETAGDRDANLYGGDPYGRSDRVFSISLTRDSVVVNRKLTLDLDEIDSRRSLQRAIDEYYSKSYKE